MCESERKTSSLSLRLTPEDRERVRRLCHRASVGTLKTREADVLRTALQIGLAGVEKALDAAEATATAEPSTESATAAPADLEVSR